MGVGVETGGGAQVSLFSTTALYLFLTGHRPCTCPRGARGGGGGGGVGHEVEETWCRGMKRKCSKQFFEWSDVSFSEKIQFVLYHIPEAPSHFAFSWLEKWKKIITPCLLLSVLVKLGPLNLKYSHGPVKFSYQSLHSTWKYIFFLVCSFPCTLEKNLKSHQKHQTFSASHTSPKPSSITLPRERTPLSRRRVLGGSSEQCKLISQLPLFIRKSKPALQFVNINLTNPL